MGIRVEQPANQPVPAAARVDRRSLSADLDRPDRGQRDHPEQQGVEPARPLTHDLFRDVIGALGHSLKEVRIVDLQEGTFYADLIFDHDAGLRPAVGLGGHRAADGVPIHVEEAVLDAAGLLIPDESDEESSGAVREDEVEKFKEFLDSVSPDDFKAG